ncbi:MAG TPA: MFS transporter [Gammaproteobacteria bacterium]|nr:MFS transporter [Gammaproteobacteria bacterium]
MSQTSAGISAAAASAADEMPPEGRKALIGAWVGFFVDMFDIYLPVIALAPAAAYFEASDVSPATSAILSSMIFAATLIGRPIGAIVFGHFGDRAGRRRTTIVAVTGFGITTLLIAALPGFESFGVPAVVALILLRFIDGIFLGGQYTSATPLALEYSPKRRRGLFGALIMTGYPLAYCAISLITFALLKVIPAGGLHSPYVQWGWRIPFVLGALLAFGFAIWYARHVKESEAWQKAPKAKAPLLELLKGKNLGNFVQVFTLMSGIWLGLNMVSAVLPRLLRNPVGLADNDVNVVLFLSYAVLALGYVGAGVLSQRIGRRTYFILAGVLTTFAAPVLFGLIVGRVVTGVAAVVLVTIVLNIIVLASWGVVSTYINERFHVGIRASGYGIGYSLAVVIPAFYAFYQVSLSSLMPMQYTPLVLLAIAGLLIWIGGAWGPETRDVDMAASEAEPPAPAASGEAAFAESR